METAKEKKERIESFNKMLKISEKDIRICNDSLQLSEWQAVLLKTIDECKDRLYELEIILKSQEGDTQEIHTTKHKTKVFLHHQKFLYKLIEIQFKRLSIDKRNINEERNYWRTIVRNLVSEEEFQDYVKEEGNYKDDI